MTHEQKDLLLKDLCNRLSHGVKIYLEDFPNATLVGVVNGGIILHCDKYDYTYDTPWDIGYIKPYLFPLSSMTEEQKKEYNRRKHEVPVCYYEYGDVVEEVELFDSPESFEYLIANHFDYYELIPMGLANDATGLNIY
jgi:hypothetical protein